MDTKTEETLRREREALRKRTLKTLEALVPGFEIELFRNQMVAHAIPGTSRRSVDVLFGDLDLDGPVKFDVRINLPATGSFDPTDRDDAKIRINVYCARPGMIIGRNGEGIEALRADVEKIASKPVMLNAVAIKETLRHYDAEARELTEACRKAAEG